MTKEELREHCEKQVGQCKLWAESRGEQPSGHVYEEHLLILELLKQEPCEDAINRKEVYEQINCWIGSGEYKYTNATDYLTNRVANLSSVTPTREHGEWIRVDDTKVKCPKCEITHFIAQYPHGKIDFCPNCGAEMEGPKDGTKSN